MKIIDRYILKRLFIMLLSVLLAFVSLYAVFDMLAESGNVGKGQYTVGTLFHYMLWRFPVYIYEIFPVAVLTASLITLTRLSAASEYVVMRACGMSMKRIVGVLTAFAVICAVGNLWVGEQLLPAAYKHSEQITYNAFNNQNAVFHKDGGVWLKSGNDMAQVGSMLPNGELKDISIYHISDDFRLSGLTHAATARYQDNGQWQLNGINESTLTAEQVLFRQPESLIWQSNITPELLGVLVAKPQQMSSIALSKYINHLKENGQRTVSYEVAKWRKIFYPWGALAMVLIALAFTPVIARHSNMGLRIFLGMCLGVGFHFLGRFFSFYAELFHIPPFIAGAMPVVLFLALAAVATFHIQQQK
ncbi:MAG: LPS export ABC transporter permease LptG [Neisseriaceae bacterium]|nr:LPS export ABC transporter permease LptG [Neisseriaceae bacterium]